MLGIDGTSKFVHPVASDVETLAARSELDYIDSPTALAVAMCAPRCKQVIERRLDSQMQHQATLPQIMRWKVRL